MKVLISSGYLGGAGGAERALHSILHALAGDEVDVVVRHRLGGHLAAVGDQVSVSTIQDWRWRGAARTGGVSGALMNIVNPLRRWVLPKYDVYLQFLSGMNLSSAAGASVRLLVPSGNQIPTRVAQHFNYVALQSPDNVRLVPAGSKSLLLPPPVLALSEESRAPDEELPGRYFLTVFNPYDPVKGLDDLSRALDTAPHPIVWCHSQQTLEFDIPAEFRDHPGVIHVDDPSPSQLRYLYENCGAYLAFSKSEGFGWSIADALRYTRAIVSRRVGVLSFPEAKVPQVIEVDEPWCVDWSLIEGLSADPDRTLAWLSPEQFRERLVRATDD